ncbi:MAG: class I SAM-dependent methyltransferase [Anaerolineae bacterium]|jgi:ubiquinone/menaquinone biosynthesis C-methylase UbiE
MTDPFGAYARFYDLDVGQVDDDLFMIREFAARTGSPILELACGTGRVLLPLAREGHQLTGVDISAAMLELARQKLNAEGLASRVNLVEQDMRHLDLDSRFNIALVALSSFSHLLTLDDQMASLQRIFEHLNPGGLLLLDLFNPDLERLLDFRGQLVLDKVMIDPASGRRLLKFRTETVDLAQQIIEVTYVVDEVGEQGAVQRTLFPFRMRYLFRYELELLLRHAGFELESIYGSYDLDEFDSASDCLVAIARRPS